MNNYTRQLAQQAVAQRFGAVLELAPRVAPTVASTVASTVEKLKTLPDNQTAIADMLALLNTLPDSYRLKEELIVKVTDAGKVVQAEDASIVKFLNEVLTMMAEDRARFGPISTLAASKYTTRASFSGFGAAEAVAETVAVLKTLPDNDRLKAELITKVTAAGKDLQESGARVTGFLNEVLAVLGQDGLVVPQNAQRSYLLPILAVAAAAGGYYFYKRQKKTSFAGYFGGMSTGDKIGTAVIVGVIGLGLYRKYSDDKTLAAAKELVADIKQVAAQKPPEEKPVKEEIPYYIAKEGPDGSSGSW